MCTTLPRSISTLAWVVCAALLALPTRAPTHAQDAPKRQKPAGTRVEWPRTFGGQPDFEFERMEAYTAVKAEKTRAGLMASPLPTLADVLGDEAIAVLGRIPVVSASVSVSGTEEAEFTEEELALPALPQGLPEIEQTTHIDLTEFEDNLVAAALQHVQNYTPDVASRNFDYVADYISVQSIMVSPEQAATLNGVRYKVGEKLMLHVPMAPADAELMATMRSLMPSLQTLPEALQKSYETAYENAVAKLAAAKAQNPTMFNVKMPLAITLMQISSRNVVVDIAGKSYTLAIKVR